VKARAAAAARRYARALLEVAVDAKLGESVRRGLQQAVELLDNQPELRAALTHPALPAERKAALVETLWKSESEPVRRLIVLLAQRERLELLPAIARLFADLWNARRGVVAAEALTAQPLPDGDGRALAAALRRATGREVELTTRVAPEILGGVVVRMDGRVYDSSVRGRLHALRERLVGRAEGA
jgi:F-type H+-transporting ATPase subunit delta